jgi:DNA primase
MGKKEEIKNRVSILDAAELYLDIKPAGHYYKSLCPFHQEKTPSFFINPQKDTFTCYGCNEYGDIFSLIEKMEKLSFPEAMDFVIDKFNLDIDKSNQKKTDTTELKEINQIALNYFRHNLFTKKDENVALKYLKDRQIKSETIDEFSIGYAQKKWDGLYNHLKSRKVSIQKAILLGLLIQKNDKIYDRFRSRIMFPIISETGTITGFGGRTLLDDDIKYLNSPESPLFKKGKSFFGLNLSKSKIRELKNLIIVEGYFDLISLYQNGIKNVIAPLGTALTPDQIYRLKRFSDRIYLLFDNDQAGIAAMARGIKLSINQGITPYILRLYEAKDPDEFIIKQGQQGFKNIIEKAEEGFLFLLNFLHSKHDFKVLSEKIKASTEIMSIITTFEDPIMKNHYLKMAADYLKIKPSELEKYKPRQFRSLADPPRSHLLVPVSEQVFIEALIALKDKNPSLLLQVKKSFNELLYLMLKSSNIIKAIFYSATKTDDKTNTFTELKKSLSDQEQALLIRIIESSQQLKEEDIEKNIKSSLENFQDKYNHLQMEELTREIRNAELKDDFLRIKELMNIKKEIRAKLFRRHG